MAVKIRLKRLGKIRAPYYRIVVVDSRKKRDGAVIEQIGKYHPTQEPSFIDVDSDRAQYWLGVGAQPSDAVAAILRVTGDWQQHKGEEGAEGTLRTAEKADDTAERIAEADQQAAKRREGASQSKATAEAGTAEDDETAFDDTASAETSPAATSADETASAETSPAATSSDETSSDDAPAAFSDTTDEA